MRGTAPWNESITSTKIRMRITVGKTGRNSERPFPFLLCLFLKALIIHFLNNLKKKYEEKKIDGLQVIHGISSTSVRSG